MNCKDCKKPYDVIGGCARFSSKAAAPKRLPRSVKKRIITRTERTDWLCNNCQQLQQPAEATDEGEEDGVALEGEEC